MVLFRFELCRLICFTNKIVITHFVEACFVSFAAEQAHRLIHSADSPLDFEPANAGLQNRKVKMFSLLLPSHNLHQMSQCSVFKVHRELSLIETFNPLKASINKLFQKNGGPKWTRTTDLTIISRVL